MTGGHNSDGGASGLQLAAALVDALDEDALDALAERLAPRLAERLAEAGVAGDEWMDAKGAVVYLGLPSLDALHRLTATRAIVFHQDRPGCKLWFRRSELDAWREAGRRGAR